MKYTAWEHDFQTDAISPSRNDKNNPQNGDSMKTQHTVSRPCEYTQPLQFFFVVTYRLAFKNVRRATVCTCGGVLMCSRSPERGKA